MRKIKKMLTSFVMIACMVFTNMSSGLQVVFAQDTDANMVDYPVYEDAYVRSSKAGTNYNYENITKAHGAQYDGLGYKTISTKYSSSDEIISAMKVKLPTKQEIEEKQLNKFDFIFHVFKNPSFNAGDQTYIYRYAADTNWDEKTLTWNNKPAFMSNKSEDTELFRFDIKDNDEYEFKTDEEKTITKDITAKILALVDQGVSEITIYSTAVKNSATSLLIHCRETAPEEMRAKMVGSFESYTIDMLKALVERYDAVKAEDYTKESYETFTTQLNAAKDVLAQETPTESDIKAAYQALEAAYQALVSVIDPNDAANIAYQKPTRSNLSKLDSYKATDGDLNTSWKGNFYPSYVDIDLLDVYELSEIKVFVPKDKLTYYTVYGSNDGKNYDELYQKRDASLGTLEGDSIKFEEPCSYRILRVYMEYTKGENAAYLSEFKAYGKKTNTKEEDLRKGTFEEILGIEDYKDTDYAVPITDDEIYENIYGIVDRTIGAEYRDWFTFEVAPNTENDNDYYELSDVNGKIHIKGNKGISITTGLNYYYKNYLKVQISEQSMQVNMPESIVRIGEVCRKETPYKVRYAYNYCTLSYTFAFFGEEEWQRENDWLALNGVNVVLDVAGQEATWIKFLMNFGYSFDDAKDWLVGPSYYAWQFMQNIETFGGPIPDQYVIDRVELARSTQRWKNALGMNTVLQGYAGMVPTNFNEFQPDVPLTKQGNWGGLSRPSMLATDSPLYDVYAKLFYEAQEYVYGATSDYYAVDPYHEGGTRPADLKDETISDEVLNSLLEYDKDAIWVVQAWQSNPTSGLLKGMGDRREDHVLIVDLIKYPLKSWTKYNASEFQGTSWAWGLLGNFGGNPTMNGQMEVMVEDIQTAKKERKHMAGLGIISEAQYDNPVLYDLIFDLAWADEDFDLNQWLNQYVERRYGATSENAREAWKIMKDANYDHGVRFTNQVFGMKSTAPQNYKTQEIPYGADKLETAFRLLVADYDKFKDSPCYRYDLTEIMRQLVSNYAVLTYNDVISARDSQDLEAFRIAKDKFLKAFDVENDVQETQQDQLAGEWIGKAQDRAAGYDDFSKSTFEMNAKALITSWASRGSTSLKDYAWRNYQGMFIDVYKQVWVDYLDQVDANLENGTPIKTISSGGYFDMYWEWVLGKQDYTRDAKDSPTEMQDVVKEVLDNCVITGEMDPNVGNKALQREVSSNTKNIDGKLMAAVDGKEDTYVSLQSSKEGETPELIIDLIGEFQLSKVAVLLENCDFAGYEVYTSSDKTEWKKIGELLKEEVDLENGNQFALSDSLGKYIKLKAIAGADEKSTSSIAIREVRVYGEAILPTLDQLTTLVKAAKQLNLDANEDSKITQFQKALEAAETAITNDAPPDEVNTVYWTLYDVITSLDLSGVKNVAYKKTISAHNDPSGHSERLVDGSTDSHWDSGRLSATGKPYEQTITPGWAIIDLKGTYDLSEIKLTFASSSQNIWHNYELYSSLDGENWTKIGEKTTQTKPNKDEDTYTFDHVYASYLKVRTTNIQVGSDNKRYSFALAELQAFGNPAQQIDVSSLKAKLLEAKDLDFEDYTADSLEELQKAMASAEKVLAQEFPSQEEMESALQALQTAIDGVLVKASTSLIASLQEATKGLMALKDAYDEAEFKTAQAAIDVAQAILAKAADNISQEEAVEAILQIAFAKNDLTHHVQLEALRQVLQHAQAILASDEITDVRPEKVTALQAAVAAAQALVDANSADTEAIAAATNNLYKAIHELYKIVDKQELKDLINSIDELTQSKYTEASWTALQEAVAAATRLLEDTNATKEEVEKACDTLVQRIVNLELRSDKKALEEQLAIANQMQAKIDNYVPSTVIGLEAAIEKAQAVMEDENASAAEVKAAWEDLIGVMAQARLKADKTGLEAVVKEVKRINLAQYTGASRAMMEQAIEQAEKILADDEATPEAVIAAMKEVEAARKGLEKKASKQEPEKKGEKQAKAEQEKGVNTGDNTAATPITMALLWSGCMLLVLKRRKQQRWHS